MKMETLCLEACMPTQRNFEPRDGERRSTFDQTKNPKSHPTLNSTLNFIGMPKSHSILNFFGMPKSHPCRVTLLSSSFLACQIDQCKQKSSDRKKIRVALWLAYTKPFIPLHSVAFYMATIPI